MGGADLITTGSGVDLILGGAGGDEIAAGAGDNLVFGDNGQIVSATSDAARLGDGATFGPATITLGRVMSTAPVIGGNDRVTTLGGNDIILAGVSGDTLETATSGDFRDVVDAGDGNNLVLGDSGLLVFAQPLDDAATTAEISLAVDPTKPVDATDPLNGGVPVDTETAVYTYGYTSDSDPSDLDWIESTAWSVGGADLITTGSGVDLILGGAGGDEIAAGAGDNLVFGDNGQIVSATSDAARLGDGATFGPATITLGRVMSTAPAIGGNDRVTTLGGNDIILAGVSGDTLETATSGDFRDVVDAGDGNNLVLGDSGLLVFAQTLDNAATTAEISLAVDPTKPVDATDPLNGGVPVDTETAVYTYGYTSDSDPSDLDWIESTAWSVGGADLITTGSGVDLILGGAGGDEIAAGFGRQPGLRRQRPDRVGHERCGPLGRRSDIRTGDDHARAGDVDRAGDRRQRPRHDARRQ